MCWDHPDWEGLESSAWCCLAAANVLFIGRNFLANALERHCDRFQIHEKPGVGCNRQGADADQKLLGFLSANSV